MLRPEKKNNFNLIEIIPSKKDHTPVLIRLFWQDKEIPLFGPTNTIEDFKNFIKKKQKKKKNIIVFYIPNLEFALQSIFILAENSTKEVRFFGIGTHIYYIRIPFADTHILFKNFNMYYQGSIENIKQTVEGHYTPLGFYPGTKEEEIKLPPYTQGFGLNNKEKEIYNKLAPKTSDSSIITSFYTEESLSKIEINKIIKELPNKLKINLINLNLYLKELDNILSIFVKNWFFNYSIASLSMEIFHKKYNFYGIETRLKSEIDNNIREAFIGGRCEVFGNIYKEEKKIYHFDFESMYGQIMLEDFPTGELKLEKNLKNIDQPGFYYVTIQSKNMDIPILPIKYWTEGIEEVVWEEADDKGVFFVNGEFSGLYYSEELELFEKNEGKIIKIHYAYLFQGKKKPLFKYFAKNLIDKKKKTGSKIFKSLLVSFYGRLGMSPTKTELILGNKEEHDNKTLKKNVLQELWIGKIFLIEVEKETNIETNSNVIYAAIITAKARIKLWKNLIITKNEGGKLLYCDTDSIFVAFPDSKKILQQQMGDIFWDPTKKNTEIKDAVFAGTKNYSIKTKDGYETKIAGLPRNSIDFEIYKETFYKNLKHTFKVNIIKKNIFNNERWNTVGIVGLSNYKKRRFSINKTETEAFYMENNEIIINPLSKLK